MIEAEMIETGTVEAAMIRTTINIDLEDAVAMMNGELNPTMAFMQGKLTVDGNMGMALKLGNLLED